MNVSALRAGLEISALGMAVVFTLLAALGGLVALLARLGTGRVPAREAVACGDRAEETAGRLPPSLLAAALVAVREHRRVRRRQAAPVMRAHWPGTLPSRWLGAGRTRQNRTWTPRGRYT